LLTEEGEKEGEDRPSVSAHSTPSSGLTRHQRRQSLPTHDASPSHSHNVPSLQDPGGLLSAAPAAPITRTTTQTSYDVPSLKDAGGLLSSTS
jgi:hypothetical protein